jgi:peptidoglycan/xylan/chitin deacetylase (PgdA/CDA1 family)
MKQLLKRTLKWLTSVLIYYTGMLWLLSFIRLKLLGRQGWTIITYHNIIGADEKSRAEVQPGMCVLADSFDKQMSYISKHCKVVSVDTLVESIRNRDKKLSKTVAVTFDDGWRDNYSEAFPILKKHNIPAMIFLATDLVKSGKIPPFLEVSILLGGDGIWPHRAVNIFRDIAERHNLASRIPQLTDERYEFIMHSPFEYMKTLMLLEYNYMCEIVDALLSETGLDKNEWRNRRWMVNTAEIREMQAAGIEFGSHGESHDLMILIDIEQVKRELKQSKVYIEGELGKPVNIMAYPNGDFNEDIKRETKAAGYKGAMAMYWDEKTKGIDIYSLGRSGMSEGACLGPRGRFSKAIFACKVAKIL